MNCVWKFLIGAAGKLKIWVWVLFFSFIFQSSSSTQKQHINTQNICITFIQRQPNVFDVGPTLYKFYTNVSRLLGSYMCISFNVGSLINQYNLCYDCISFFKWRFSSTQKVWFSLFSYLDVYLLNLQYFKSCIIWSGQTGKYNQDSPRIKLQVGKNYYWFLFILRPNICKYWCLSTLQSHFGRLIKRK